MCVLMRRLVTFHQRKNGLYEKSEPYWKDQDTKVGSHREKTILFSLHHFPTMLKAEGSYILPDNVPANGS
jgi:hypothetical protein